MGVKICLHCGREFMRPARCSEWEWERRTFCSQACLHAFNAAHRAEVARAARSDANTPINERQSQADIRRRCRSCGRVFWGARDQMYCGPVCEDRARRLVTAMRDFLELMQP